MNRKRVVCFGEVLWDQMIDGACIGGAPLNVCYHLSKLGIDSQIVSMVGDDEAGELLLQEIQRLGLGTAYCGVHPTAETSRVLVNLYPDNKVHYEIVENVSWDFIPYSEELYELVKGSDALVYGTLAARSSESRATLLRLLAASDNNILDVNLRGDFYNKSSVFELVSYADLLKINDEEVRMMSEWLAVENEAVLVMKAIFEAFPRLREIILTEGAEGATYFSREDRVKIGAREINVVNTVGSGDAFLAGFVAERLQHKDVSSALNTAVTLSAFVAQHEGACPAYHVDELKSQDN
jgi:fructokinase